MHAYSWYNLPLLGSRQIFWLGYSALWICLFSLLSKRSWHWAGFWLRNMCNSLWLRPDESQALYVIIWSTLLRFLCLLCETYYKHAYKHYLIFSQQVNLYCKVFIIILIHVPSKKTKSCVISFFCLYFLFKQKSHACINTDSCFFFFPIELGIKLKRRFIAELS